jgi:integrase
MRPDNPVHGVIRFADGKLERRLTDTEYAMLGDALQKAEGSGIWPPAISAVRLLALTGWRRNEALELRWEEIELDKRTANCRTRRLDDPCGLCLTPRAMYFVKQPLGRTA